MTEHDLTESQLVGSRVRDARINRRMSQADLAAKANISLPHISNIEKGKTSMKLETFICKYLLIPSFGPMCRR